MTPPRKLTAQQREIYEAVRGTRHVIVEALAGSGKTSTAVGCLQQGVRGKVGFVAFNKHIATELAARLPAEVPALTLHSLGFSAVRKVLKGPAVDERKLGQLAKELTPKAWPSTRQAAEQLARLIKYTLSDERDAKETAALADTYGVEVEDRYEVEVFALARQLVEESSQRLATIDYDDMVWLPTRMSLPVDQFDLLLVDEAQDLNRAQQQLALSATRDGRLMAIGDRYQAIYGFTGADCEGLPSLAGKLGLEARGCDVLPLTITWRCPRSHVALAQHIVPALEAAPGAADGEVRTMSGADIAKTVKPGDLVISRCNAPAVNLTYKLVLAGTRAVMRGRDIGKGLTALIARLKPDSVIDLVDKIEDYRANEERRLRKRDAPSSQFDALADRCDCLSALAAQSSTLEALTQFIGSVFSDTEVPGSQVVLSSIHRSKGLEADNVFVLDPGSLPLVRKDQKPWQRQQERHLVYIAATRAKRTLTFEGHIPEILTGDTR